jgi:two-component system, NtrC family, response regulator AtoC
VAEEITVGLGDQRAVDRTSLRLRIAGAGMFAVRSLPSSGQLLIGRADEADVMIDDPSVSRRHAILHLGATLCIEDLGSANGTVIGGKRIGSNELREIAPGDAIELGAVMLMVQKPVEIERPRRIWTHGYFEGRVEEECMRAESAGGCFAVARIDVLGDRDTQEIGELLARELEPTDVLASYGPRAWEVLMLDVLPTQASERISEIASMLRSEGLVLESGLACFGPEGRTPEELMANACAQVKSPADPAERIVFDASMKQLYRLLERIAAGEISVLLLGETGVGKEVVAEAVHRMSPRKEGPFLRLNCAALSETLLESELFGHEKGAFTGAVEPKQGLLETAQHGTVFLDELGELPMPIQVKLLRVIEERRVLRVGGLQPRPIDVRFVSATNRDLEAEIERGTFRRDLFYRLNGFSLMIPPLRERTSEIRPLAEEFVRSISSSMKRSSVPQISKEAWSMLHSYRWPGNIRELKNVIERAVLLADDIIGPAHLPIEKMTTAIVNAPKPAPIAIDPQADLRSELGLIERQKILETLDRCGGNQSRAAKELGIARSTLLARLEAYGIPRPRKK